MWVPGSPPSPFAILNALLIATGKLAAPREHDDERALRGGADSPGGGRASRADPLAARVGCAASPYVLGAAGAACLAAAGGFALAGRTVTAERGRVAGRARRAGQAPGLAVDRLSGLFLVMALGAAVPVSAAFASWAAGPGSAGPSAATRMLAQGYALALGATVVIMTAQDAFTALFGWEALTAAFYLLAGAKRGEPDRGGAARVTVAFGKVSGAALLVGLLLLAARSHSIVAGVVHARARRRGQDHGAGAAARRVRGQGGPGALPGLAAARVRGGTAPRPGRSWRACASTSGSTACGGRSRCSVTRPAGSPGSCCCSAGCPPCSASRTPPCRTGCHG